MTRADLRPYLVPGAVAVLLVAAYLAAPPMGSDLSAQTARADFFHAAGFAPVDLRWYGGTVQYGYSLVTPAVMAVLGVRLTGAVAVLGATLSWTALLLRTGARRPVLGGAVGAVAFAGNLVSGRVTFAVGVLFGLLALVALAGAGRRRWLLVVPAALLAAAASPVAGLFLGLAGVALALGGTGRRRAGVLLGVLAAVPLGVTAALSDAGGWMNISLDDTVHAGLTGLAVAAVVPRRAVRVGAVLSTAGVVAAFAVHTPVGLNATRLASMFALPVVCAYTPLPPWGVLAARRGWAVAVGLAGALALALWQPPVLHADLTGAGGTATARRYYAPLVAELSARAPAGRVEVVATHDYWEAAYVARRVPLARGWLRQTDLARNPLFFDGSLTAGRYGDWLRRNGVAYVALPDATLSWVARREADLVRAGQPYLTEVWQGEHWTLYAVAGAPSIVDGADLVAAGPTTVTLAASGPGDVLVRIRYSHWLSVRTGPRGARLSAGPDGWTTLHVATAGCYTVGA